MSAITTTGATVIVGLDNLPRAVLLAWHAAMVGGIGIIVMAMAIYRFASRWYATFQAESSIFR